jgi:hypothetical protein
MKDWDDSSPKFEKIKKKKPTNWKGKFDKKRDKNFKPKHKSSDDS